MKFQVKLKSVAMIFAANNASFSFGRPISKIWKSFRNDKNSGSVAKITTLWIAQSPKSVTIVKSNISRASSRLVIASDLKVIFLFKTKEIRKVTPVETPLLRIFGSPSALNPKRITKSSAVLNPPIATNLSFWLFFSLFWRFFTAVFLNFLR